MAGLPLTCQAPFLEDSGYMQDCHTPKNDHVRTLKILLSMSGSGGLRTHEQTQLAFVGLDSAALAAAVALPR